GIDMLGMLIDTGTIFYRAFRPKTFEFRETKEMTVSAICPVYNEEDTLEDGIRALICQTIPLLNIYILDDCSTDNTETIGIRLQTLYPSMVEYRRMRQNGGKARNINDLVENTYNELGDLIFINDGDCIPLPDCIEELKRKFSDKAVVGVTGYPIVTETGSLVNSLFTKGKKWQINSLHFRKSAQCLRDAMSVLCGAVSLYDKRILRKQPMPMRTATEDLDHTWMLLEDGYRLEFENIAFTVAPDVGNLKSQWAQAYRWNKGFWQTFYFHTLDNRLDRSPMLKYTVVYVAFLDFFLLICRFVLIAAFAITGEVFFLYYIFLEMLLLVIPGITFYGIKGVIYLPFNYLYQILVLITNLCSGYEITRDYLSGNILKWSNRWKRDYGKRTLVDNSIGLS
ncbi:MAG: glycosyltransferase family 2 protein, partial [Euryarchaeota archaeon]|nr:glycosyltransferase family 2 protein [Euryarchaeota archaeon]